MKGEVCITRCNRIGGKGYRAQQFEIAKMPKLHVEELISHYAVDTMTLQKIESFRDHGRVRLSLEENIPQAKVGLSILTKVGLSKSEIHHN